MRRRARAILGSDEEARDATQEVFVRVAAHYEDRRSDVPMLRWIYRITTNLCLNLLRKRRTHPLVDDPARVLEIVSSGGHREDRSAVMSVLGRVDETTRTIVVYYYLDEMSLEEVAETVGYSRKTVARKLERFRRRARAMLSDRGVGWT